MRTDAFDLARFQEPLADRYQIQRLLGQRIGRQTLLAIDLQTQTQVVIKLLALGKAFQWQDLKLFEREAQVLQTLSHPAIPRYLDYLNLDTPAYKGFALVQSYVEGKSLEEHLKAGRTFSEAGVKQLASALLKVLAYLHQHSPPVIHRDLKPSNILLSDRDGSSIGQVYLVDFGSVQTIAAKEGGTITVVGTYGYMPPEQFGGRANPASDLYSLGATLIFLVTGRHPTELPQQDFRIQFRQMARLSPAFADWLTWLTEPSLDRRLSSAQQALKALQQPRYLPQKASERPAYTGISVTKTTDSIEVLLPPKGLTLGFLAKLSFFIPLLVIWLPLIARSSQGMGPVIWLIVGTTAAVLIVRSILLQLFRQTRLYIGDRTVSLTNQMLGLQWHTRSAPKREIRKIEFMPRSLKLHSSKFKYLRREESLTLWVGKQTYRINQNSTLTNEELRWLAEELIAWLDASR